MTDFNTVLEETLGQEDAFGDIRVVVRNLWFYDFLDAPARLWDGKGLLFTDDGNEWMGTINAEEINAHVTPSIQDGRDGSSASYTMSLVGLDPATYDALKADKDKARGRKITVYLAIFKEGEALRPDTPISFFKEMIILDVKFSESASIDSSGVLVNQYKASVTAKDNNFGRANRPNGSYADAIQKERARQLGVALDKGSEHLSGLANRTFVIP